MRLEFGNKLENSEIPTKKTNDFINELSNYIEKIKDKISSFVKQNKERKENIKNMQEEGLYYVLSGNPEKVYLTKFKSKKVFEATNLPQDIKNAVSEGFILRYKDGEYTIDEELTDRNFEGELNIDEYEEE